MKMLDKQKHQVILLKILKDIYADAELMNLLVFKGGTCAYFFHHLDRFSVDLDFSLRNPQMKELVFAKIKTIMEKYGTLTDAWIKANTILLELSYERGLQNLKIEISTREETLNFEVRNLLGIDMVIMRPEDIFANKLLALTQRKKTANRDIYDLYFFFRNHFEINAEMIRSQTGKSLNEYLGEVIAFLKKVDTRKILDGLGEVVDLTKKLWIREKLIPELIFEIEAYLLTAR